MTALHDLDCPCWKCEEARQAYDRWLDERDAEQFATWQAREAEKHAGCTDPEHFCRECREGFEEDMRRMAEEQPNEPHDEAA
jgi:hypothetical protein